MSPSPSLLGRFAALADPRSPSGRRHPLPAFLGLVTVAILCGARSLEGVAQFARDRRPAFNAALGFTRRQTPCKATLSNLLRRLDVAAFERALSAWIADRLGPGDALEIALDGKAVRGSADGALPGIHLLAAFAPAAAVLAQVRVDVKTNEHKAALELLGVLPPSGAVVTADAMFTHADFAAAVLQGGGDYILPVKDNQPRLRADIALAFETPEGLSPRQRHLLESARSSDKAHGRRERRAPVSTTVPDRVLRLARPGASVPTDPRADRGGKTTEDVTYGVTSLPRHREDARRLLELARRHWGIENRLHYVRDVTLGEDACRVRSGSAPQILAGLRNAAVHLLTRVRPGNLAAATRHLLAKPRKAVALVSPKREN